MGSPPESDLPQLLAELRAMEYGPERLAAADRGIRCAAIQGDDDAGFAFREDLLLGACLAGRLGRAIAAMEWCLARCDQDPNRFDIRRVLFQYKWIIEEVPRHLAYDASTIEEGLADLERRFASAGWGCRGPLEVRMLTAWTMGEMATAAELHERWREAPVDEGSDCPACATAHTVRHLINADLHQEAIDAAAPLLSGEQQCFEEPTRCFSRLQYSLLYSNRADEAFDLHERSIEAAICGPQFGDARVGHILFLLLTGNVEIASRLFEVTLPQAIEADDDLTLLKACEIGWVVLEVLRRRRLDMPSLGSALQLGIHDMTGWSDWMRSKAETLGKAFDQRNGNDGHRATRDGYRQLTEHLASA